MEVHAGAAIFIMVLVTLLHAVVQVITVQQRAVDTGVLRGVTVLVGTDVGYVAYAL